MRVQNFYSCVNGLRALLHIKSRFHSRPLFYTYNTECHTVHVLKFMHVQYKFQI